ncbi:MAG: PEPxxWA-CTERM sorting domain-containing protein [Parasphingorhabdus sp.]|uniref:PEPxxWA-CTERM sorting domain-containing protein n=1 Tax=Parasphingorhabdus sp. TaxID=2709688 RepID=UPI003299C534
MKKIAYMAACLAAPVAFASPAQALTMIDFDDGTDGASVDAFYSGLGITFSNTQFTDNFGLAGSSGPLGIRATGTFQFGVADAIVGTFSGLADSVSFRGIDVGSAGLQIDAFDASNVLLGSTSVSGSDFGIGDFFDLTFASPGIKSFAIYQPNFDGSDGILIEDLAFNLAAAVPEPATWAFMIFGFGAIGGAMRRQRKANVKVSYA